MSAWAACPALLLTEMDEGHAQLVVRLDGLT
jgi:hypothetical protein